MTERPINFNGSMVRAGYEGGGVMGAYIEVRAEVRYWEDATVNGVEDSDGSLVPLRDGDLWRR